MANPQAKSKPAPTTTVAKRVHNRKPLMELLATKLESALETSAQLGHFACACRQSADERFHSILDGLAKDAEALQTAQKIILASYTKLVDGKFAPAPAVKIIRPAGFGVGDKVSIVPEFAPRYESFSPWRGCTKETLEIVHVDGSDYLLRRPGGGDVFVRSAKHIARVS